MANVMRVEGDVYVAGDISGRTTTLADGSVTNDAVAAAADIVASKLEHQYTITVGEESAVGANDQSVVAHVCRGLTGLITGFSAGHVAALEGTEVTEVELLINGATCLTGAIALDNGDAAYAVVAGTIDDGALAVDDVIEVVFDWTTGDGDAGAGQFATIVLTEKAV
jgi:hypothetical protein